MPRKPTRRAETAGRIPEPARRVLQQRGWTVTASGNVDLGLRVGPCTRCQVPTVRYGPTGQPWCPECR